MADTIDWRHVIGIVGGLGPHAHIELERQLLAATARILERPPQDQDYPPWLLASFPETPDRTLGLLAQGPSPLSWLERSARSLIAPPDGQRADFIVMACVTAHAYLVDLQRRVPVPILDLVEETVRVAADTHRGSRIGLLATTGTLRSGIYQQAAERLRDRPTILSLPDLEDGGHTGEWLQEYFVMEPVYGPLRGDERLGGGLKSGVSEGPAASALSERLDMAVGLLLANGVEVVILGCTEIPMVLRGSEIGGVPLLDPLAVAATAAVDIAAGRRPFPRLF